jgi:hypothetical protein
LFSFLWPSHFTSLSPPIILLSVTSVKLFNIRYSSLTSWIIRRRHAVNQPYRLLRICMIWTAVL